MAEGFKRLICLHNKTAMMCLEIRKVVFIEIQYNFSTLRQPSDAC